MWRLCCDLLGRAPEISLPTARTLRALTLPILVALADDCSCDGQLKAFLLLSPSATLAVDRVPSNAGPRARRFLMSDLERVDSIVGVTAATPCANMGLKTGRALIARGCAAPPGAPAVVQTAPLMRRRGRQQISEPSPLTQL
jgi:hypothetical protein